MRLRLGRCRLHDHLVRVGMSQAEFARRMSISPAMVTYYINGKKDMSLLRATIAARILDCHAEDFYELDHE